MTIIGDILNRARTAESSFAGTELIAPVIKGHPVRVRIGGVACKLQVRSAPHDFDGLALLRAQGTRVAVFRRPAHNLEWIQYVTMFPRVRLILIAADGDRWLALRGNDGDTRFQVDGLVSVRMVGKGARALDTIVTHFDGAFFWYGGPLSSRAIYRADAMRAELAKHESDSDEPAHPDALSLAGLLPEERRAYTVSLAALGVKVDRVAVRLSKALKHAGAEFAEYAERGDSYVVAYMVGGTRHTSLVRRDDLTVETAGICLAGTDRHFDLTSLIGVLREGERRRLIVNTPLREAREAYTDEMDRDNDDY